MAEDAWNSRDPQRVALASTPDSRWHSGDESPTGREQIALFLERTWSRQRDHREIKELWTCAGNRIAVRFACEFQDGAGRWFRAHGNENWEFDEQGLLTCRHASTHPQAIGPEERKFLWRLGRRPDDHPGLGALGL
jgi:hypothetical protein